METLKQRLYIGSSGITLQFQCRDYNYAPIDCSTATVKNLLIKKPDDYEITKTLSVNGTSNYILEYTTEEDVFDQVGTYFLQVEVTIGTMHTFSEMTAVEVYDIFEQ